MIGLVLIVAVLSGSLVFVGLVAWSYYDDVCELQRQVRYCRDRAALDQLTAETLSEMVAEAERQQRRKPLP